MRFQIVWLLAASAITFAGTNQIQNLTERMPVYFEPNVGQLDSHVRFVARGAKYQAWITDQDMVLAFSGSNSPAKTRKVPDSLTLVSNAPPIDVDKVDHDLIRIGFGRLHPSAAVGLEQLASYSNYFIGNDPKKWRTNVPNYAKVKLEGVYPGIDVVFYGKNHELEYDFLVNPGADVGLISVSFEGPQKPRVDLLGNVSLRTRFGTLTHRAPIAFQGKQLLQATAPFDGRRLGFGLGLYDHSQVLNIDPVLEYSISLGGSNPDVGRRLAVDSLGNAYVTGYTYSADFPTTPNEFDTSFNGGYSDVFVAKLNVDGAVIYSTYLGGAGYDDAFGIAVDPLGNAYVTGGGSADFPTTPGTFTTGNCCAGGIFVTKLSANGSALIYSSLWVAGNDSAEGIAVDASGNAYITGWTASAGFPTTTGAFATTFNGGCQSQCGFNDGFVAELNASGSALIYSTFLGGTDNDQASGIAVDTLGNAYVTGLTSSANFPTTAGAFDTTFNGGEFGDPFVAKLNPTGSALVYSTFLGTAQYPGHIAIDALGNAYISGTTASAGFPTTPGAYAASFNGGYTDVFVTKVSTAGNSLIYSTFLGGNGGEYEVGIAVDVASNAFITGSTSSANFPTTPGALNSFNGTGQPFISKLNATGDLAYSTGVGNNHIEGIAVDALGNAYVTGGSGDVFVARISPANPPDTTPPAIAPQVSPAPNAMGWNNSDVTLAWTVSDPESGIASSSGCGTVTLTTNTNGTTFTCSATNGAGLQNSASVTLKVDKTVPTIVPNVNPPPNPAGWNNSNVTLTWAVVDPESGLISSTGCTGAIFASNTSGTTLTCSATNVAGLSNSASVTIKLDKTPPVVASLTVTPSPALVGTSISLTANLTDGGPSGLALAEYSIDGGVRFAPLGSVSGASATVAGSLGPFATPQVLNLCIRATDVAGNQSPRNCTLLAIFDPSGGSAVGQGIFFSPPGALVGSAASGNAQFEFDVKYLPRTMVPDGTTKFKFNAEDFDFSSTSSDWLVVAGARAQFKGIGTIKGKSDSFTFIVSAIDGKLPEGGGQDKFRIKITGPDGVVYDNQLGAPDTRDPTTVITGSIVIHK